MIHHLKIYNPKNLRSDRYKSPTVGENARVGIAGFGLEWLLPIAGLLLVLLVVLNTFSVPRQQQTVFISSALLWSYLMFGVIHDCMHLNRPRLMRIPLVSSWFLRARRFHDIHHIQIDSRGIMNKNFGICFFFTDRLFGTLEKKGNGFDEESYRRALVRYSFIS